MRIAQIAPLTEAIPPKLYGGTERVVHWLTEELVALGHDVTLFASGDSITSAKLEAMWDQSLRLSGSIPDPNPPHLTLPEPQPVFTAFSSIPVVSISNAQRRPVPQAGWIKTIYHGVPEDLLRPQPVTPSYLAFLGRIAPEKGVDQAIRIAGRASIPIKIAAKIDKADVEYFEE